MPRMSPVGSAGAPGREESPAMYSKTTRSVTVTVQPEYLDDQSRPEEGHFVWAYHVTIENGGEQTVQLLNRYWRIVDGTGRAQEVRGPGVVGEQPVLRRPHRGDHELRPQPGGGSMLGKNWGRAGPAIPENAKPMGGSICRIRASPRGRPRTSTWWTCAGKACANAIPI